MVKKKLVLSILLSICPALHGAAKELTSAENAGAEFMRLTFSDIKTRRELLLKMGAAKANIEKGIFTKKEYAAADLSPADIRQIQIGGEFFAEIYRLVAELHEEKRQERVDEAVRQLFAPDKRNGSDEKTDLKRRSQEFSEGQSPLRVDSLSSIAKLMEQDKVNRVRQVAAGDAEATSAANCNVL